ncbi:uncharacterized protein LOC122939680 [Bufo gargarizans]|uniref:uncharacterized protein LOC122939680 n=1 Tax=Bufo gargarizans TaxID=30331 RepID=UPI001CF30E81|nr:uncharacterized protein LOC122939680 [Bufo gargarizans]
MSISIGDPDDTERCYLFSRQVKFKAKETLAAERSDNFIIPKPIPEHNIWKKKPPDFSVRLYRSLTLPRRTEENNVKERKDLHRVLKRNEIEVIREAPPPCLTKSKEPERFLTRFKPMEPFEANILYVKNGVYPKDKYKDQKPHDFRQYQTDLPDIITSYSRDPFNLKFKAQVLSSSCELPPIEAKKRQAKVKRFILHKPTDPQWDSGLVLPRSPWPRKSASYTRHRRRRGVYTAFMDRVEEKFTASNQNAIER